jgi:hypothetical protein
VNSAEGDRRVPKNMSIGSVDKAEEEFILIGIYEERKNPPLFLG